jgi:acyl dehydratase
MSSPAGRIDDTALADMRTHIGEPYALKPWNEITTADAIRRFAAGIGDDNPLWWDEAYGKSSPWGGMIAPPSYLYSGDTGLKLADEAHRLSVADYLPGVLGFWSGDVWKFPRPVRLGERLRGEGMLHDVRETRPRPDGRTLLQVERSVYTGDNGEVVAELERTYFRTERRDSASKGYGDYKPARYSDEERAALRRHYDAEPRQRRGSRPRAWHEVEVGEPLGRLAKGPFNLTSMVGYFIGVGNPLLLTNRLMHDYLNAHPGVRVMDDNNVEDTVGAAHWDPYHWTQAGMPNGYDVGSQRIAWMTHLLTDWCGDAGWVAELSARIKRPNFYGDLTWITGSVIAKRCGDNDEPLVDCAVEAHNQRGELTAFGSATLRLPE